MNGKKKRRFLIGAALVLALLILALTLVPNRTQTVYDKTNDYLTSLGYPCESVQNVEIRHSTLARILGYNEWRISAEFKEEPGILFWMSYKKGEILFEGVSAEPMLDKEETIAYSERFKNGTLLSD